MQICGQNYDFIDRLPEKTRKAILDIAQSQHECILPPQKGITYGFFVIAAEGENGPIDISCLNEGD